MTQRILLISGCKQSGKSSAMNYLTGYLLQQAGVITKFSLDEGGNLLVPQKVTDPETGSVVEEWGRLDLTRKDPEYGNAAAQQVWPLIKPYHFADNLKEVAVVVFGLNREQINGTDEDKNKLSPIKWENIYKLLPHLKPKKKKVKKGEEEEVIEDEVVRGEYATNREFMEVWGTDIARALYNECWIQGCMNQIVAEDWPLAVVPDCRFKDEVVYCRELGAKVVRLTRNPFKGKHSAETNLLDYDGFDAVINNEDMTQEQKGQQLVRILQEWGWIN